MEGLHKSYEERFGHIADFRVKYKFYSTEENGRKTIPFQGIRSDFYYDHADHKKNNIFMIWPEFEDVNGNGNVILENNKPVPKEGTAKMWVVAKERRVYHCERIKTGTTGHFREGGRQTGECEVIEILGLCSNPGI